MRQALVGLVTSVVLVGCSTISAPARWGEKGAEDFCQTASNKAKSNSTEGEIGGWITTGLGIAVASAGLWIGPGKEPDSPRFDDHLQYNRNSALAVGGALLGAIGVAILNRADDNSRFAAETGRAMAWAPEGETTLKPAEVEFVRYQKCVQAYGTWLDDRTDADRLSGLMPMVPKTKTDEKKDSPEPAETTE